MTKIERFSSCLSSKSQRAGADRTAASQAISIAKGREFRRPFRTELRFEGNQTLRVWLISGCAFSTTVGADRRAARPTRPMTNHNSRRATVIGSRAARMAGNKPPISPITAAQVMPRTNNAGVTRKAKVSWLKLWKFMVEV